MNSGDKSTNKKDWAKLLKRGESGSPYCIELNVISVLEHAEEFTGALRYDSFADQIKIQRPLPWHNPSEKWELRTWSDRDRIELQSWLQSNGLLITKSNVVQDSVIATAHRREVHPVREYLNGLRGQWDGVPRIKEWLPRYMNARDNPAYLQEIGPKFLIGAVARIMNQDSAGVQMDTMLVLEGATGEGKTSTVRILSNGWFTDVANELHDKDAAINIQGVWFGELGELTALARSQIESAKQFISRIKDKYRPPYGRNSIERPRQCVFVATTEECEYLQDLGANRRFWPVDCGRIDLMGLARDKDQLWAEALDAFCNKAPHHLEKPAQTLAYREQLHRRRISPLEVEVLEFLDRLRSQHVVKVTMRQILSQCFQIDTQELKQSAGGPSREVARVMTSNGWRKERPTGRGEKREQPYVYDAARDPLVLMESHATSQGQHTDKPRFLEGENDGSQGSS